MDKIDSVIKHKKILLVSPYPFSHSSRGMDVLTRCFDEEGWDTDHLVFPRVFYTPRVSPPKESRVRRLYAKLSPIPYVDKYMSWFPPFLFNFVMSLNNRTVKKIDFSSYDYIVLESGKPLFLLDIIPEDVPIIYRQSDSVQLVLGKNKTYHSLEKKVFERSRRIVLKKKVYLQFLTDEQNKKARVIENGMVIPTDLHEKKSFLPGTKNAVYVGLHRLDSKTLEELFTSNRSCHFHIIGPCLGNPDILSLRKFDNFHYYHFLSKEEYMPMLRDADLAIFPFRRTESMKWFGLTSKILHFMFFKLPIVSYPTGVPGEFDGLSVLFAENPKDFAQKVSEQLERGEKIEYRIDFNYYSRESRDREYKDFIGSLA